MPYTTVVPSTTITAAWGNANVRDQVVTPFASAAARASAITTPIAGMATYITATKALELYDGTGYGPSQFNYIGGTTPRTANSAGVTTTETQIDVFTTTLVANRRYRVTWDGIISNNTAGNNIELRLRYASGASVSSAGTLIRGKLHSTPGTNITMPCTITATISTLPAGQTTIGAFLITTFGGGTSISSATANYATEMWIEDIGPV